MMNNNKNENLFYFMVLLLYVIIFSFAAFYIGYQYAATDVVDHNDELIKVNQELVNVLKTYANSDTKHLTIDDVKSVVDQSITSSDVVRNNDLMYWGIGAIAVVAIITIIFVFNFGGGPSPSDRAKDALELQNTIRELSAIKSSVHDVNGSLSRVIGDIADIKTNLTAVDVSMTRNFNSVLGASGAIVPYNPSASAISSAIASAANTPLTQSAQGVVSSSTVASVPASASASALFGQATLSAIDPRGFGN